MVLVIKNSHANIGDISDMGSIPGSGRSLQDSCLENPMDMRRLQSMDIPK